MTIATILVVDPTAPTEVQAWLDGNSSVTITSVAYADHAFYIFYTP